ncbi:hypothetical protein FBD94_18735 [Pedobacter hiemivivus]|uniref:DUF4369 domain-containing protein n=1 Tax=Pedobacter hiemivivus TaxID=2530454 RepID=A0A4U1G316_9SPHI|nr:hypothetical protein [Pedobacter hiemivivus]TKC57995.1 hypothetical protein FBD94_18735 [Pedobacter hiemivivus]
MKKHVNYWIVLLLLLTFSVSKAQENYQPGYAILNDGTRVSGSILIYDDAPWFNQRFIFLKDSVAIIGNPDVKPKKYKVDDMKFYQAGSRAFEKIHFVDAENLQLKSLGSNDHMMERLSAGRINSYRFYSYPEEVEVYMMTTPADIAEKRRLKTNELIRGFKILAIKDNTGKPKNAFDADLQKYFEDTPEVLQKYKNGTYGNEPIMVKKGLAARMVAMAMKTAFKPKEAEAIIVAFNDYNEKNISKK